VTPWCFFVFVSCRDSPHVAGDGIAEVIVPALREHLAVFAEDDPGALVSPAPRASRCQAESSDRASRTSGSGVRTVDLLLARGKH
jgi:hypothetical protein